MNKSLDEKALDDAAEAMQIGFNHVGREGKRVSYRDHAAKVIRAYEAMKLVENEAVEQAFTREQIDSWLTENCGKGLPHGDAHDEKTMLHGLSYVLRQIENEVTYRPRIGQTNSATSSLRMALDKFAIAALAGQEKQG